MVDIGFYHPLVVHFAIGLVMIGVLFRWISLRTTLQNLLAEFPDSERVRRRLEQMGSNAK